MAEFTITDNFGSISKKLQKIVEKFPSEIDQSMFNISNRVAAEVKKKTPKQSGRLSKSIQARKTRFIISLITKITYIVSSPLKYNEFVEFGSKAVKGKLMVWKDLGTRPFRGRKGKLGTGKTIFATARKAIEGFFMYTDTEKRAERILKVGILRTLKDLAERIRKTR